MSFPGHQEAFQEENGWGFTYIVALVESERGGPPTAADARSWADSVGVEFPVLSDKAQALIRVTDYAGPIPYRCALTPDMVMIKCFQGEPGAIDPAIEAIREHQALANPGTD